MLARNVSKEIMHGHLSLLWEHAKERQLLLEAIRV